MRETASTRIILRGRPRLTDRPTLPAGHPVSWGAITAGTVLDGERYPLPVFLNEGGIVPQPGSAPS